ncbi:helix-turn-helix transcriptional regulator [Natronospora cellulosivora (SeqCode)]
MEENQRLSRLYRLIKMITLLESTHKKWTASDLADYFQVSERTFHRDREILERIMPLYYDSSKKTYAVLDTFSFNPPSFTRDEAVALAMAARAFKVENFPYKNDLDMALAKMLNSLPESICEVLETLGDKMTALGNPLVDLASYRDEINYNGS